MKPVKETIYQPKGPFDLLYQNQFFNGWPLLLDGKTIVMTFPVEGWHSSAAVTMSQNDDGTLSLSVYGDAADADKAISQALAAISLDEDGTGWQAVGERDATLKELQAEYHYLRPSLFHSPYEAATAFLAGHRISIAQRRKITANLSREFGQKFTIDGQDFYAFPSPQQLLEITEYPGLNLTKIERIHAAARAALDGWLDREYLREMEHEAALAKIETLPGVGAFFSQGILDRGAGGTNSITSDDITYHAIGLRYGLGDSPTKEQIERVTETWQPYRMWAVVLHHIWARQNKLLPKRTFGKR